MGGKSIFITGGTGYLGRSLIPLLVERGHSVRALVRAGSETRLPPGCTPVLGNALDHRTFAAKIQPADTFVQLIGVAHPSPAKAAQFQTIDLVSVRESVEAAKLNRIQHFIYLSVAQPAPLMKAYVEVRQQGEAMIRSAGLNATMLRPWYVLGPGHRWPMILLPIYWLCERLPGTRESALRLGMVTLNQMLGALVEAVETPVSGLRMLEVPSIRSASPASESLTGF